jgi:hypothetical protein
MYYSQFISKICIYYFQIANYCQKSIYWQLFEFTGLLEQNFYILDKINNNGILRFKIQFLIMQDFSNNIFNICGLFFQ